jgi:hypothetical protein
VGFPNFAHSCSVVSSNKFEIVLDPFFGKPLFQHGQPRSGSMQSVSLDSQRQPVPTALQQLLWLAAELGDDAFASACPSFRESGHESVDIQILVRGHSGFVQGAAELYHRVTAGSFVGVASCDVENVRVYDDGEAAMETFQHGEVLRRLCHERAEGRQAAPGTHWDVLVLCQGGAV